MSINERIAKVKWWASDGSQNVEATKASSRRVYDWQHSPADAHELVEELVAEGAYVCIESPTKGVKADGDTTWRCSVEMPDQRMISADADTMAEAVCAAWLEVKEG